MKITTNPAKPAVTQQVVIQPAKPATHTLELSNRELVVLGALAGAMTGSVATAGLYCAASKVPGYREVYDVLQKAIAFDGDKGSEPHQAKNISVHAVQAEFDEALAGVEE